MVIRSLAPLALSLSLAVASGCGKERLVPSLCHDDGDCGAGKLCEDAVCVNASTKRCDAVVGGRPLLQPSPPAVSLGEVTQADAGVTVELHNIGTCALTVFEASVAGTSKGAFSCPTCAGAFPVDIFPGRSVSVPLELHATAVGKLSDALVLLSDDAEFPQLEVPLHATYLGTPKLTATPSPLDFGYVEKGRALDRKVQLSNQGSGTAAVTVQAVAVVPDSTDFEVKPLEAERALAPLAADPMALLPVTVTYHPRTSAQHAASLKVTTDQGELLVPLKGNAATPPKLTVQPDAIRLGDVVQGNTALLPLTLLNEGGSPLTVKHAWSNATPPGDLFATPAVLPDIAPGAYQTVQVGITATAVGPVTALLVLTTNDPARPQVTVTVTANVVKGAGPAVLKVEMVFENGSDSAFDNDLRNVDLTLEHPFGYVCNKQNPHPTGWGAYGDATWLAVGLKEEPERVVLANATADGTYRVMLQYQEDCASLPTELSAAILGIGVDALIAYLTGGSGGGIINGQDVGKLITKVCVQHSTSNATVRVSSNGVLIKEKTVALSKKGDSLYALDVQHVGGVFTSP